MELEGVSVIMADCNGNRHAELRDRLMTNFIHLSLAIECPQNQTSRVRRWPCWLRVMLRWYNPDVIITSYLVFYWYRIHTWKLITIDISIFIIIYERIYRVPWITIYGPEWGDSLMIFTSDAVTSDQKIVIHGNPYAILFLTRCYSVCNTGK